MVDTTVQYRICLQALERNVGSAAGTQLPIQHNLSQHCKQHFGMGWLHDWDAAAQDVCTATGEVQNSRLRCRCVVAMISAACHKQLCLPAFGSQPAFTGTDSCMPLRYASHGVDCTDTGLQHP